MRIRSFAISAAVAATLLTSSALVTEAQAQQRLMLNPTTEWAVSKVADKNGQGKDYCALARRFNQKTILTLAKNHSDEASLALDFQGSSFQTGQNMRVALDPGAGQQRVFEDIRPVSDNAFVVRLGNDASFFSALERTGFLRVEAGGKSYGFNITDINSGTFRLSSCLATMIQPSAGEEEIESAEVDHRGSYRQEINGLRRQLNELREENKKMSGLLDTTQSSVPPLPAEGLRDEIGALSDNIVGLEKENQSLREQLSSARSVGSSASSAELAELRLENKTLLNQLSSVKKEDIISSSVMLALETENERLLEQLDSVDQKDTVSLVTVKALEAENRELRERLSSVATDDTQSVVALSKLEEDNAELRTQLAAIKKEDTISISALKALEDENEELRGQLQTASSGGSIDQALKTQIIELKGANAALKNGLQENAQNEEERRNALVAENEKLQAVVEAQERLASVAVDLKAQISTLSQEKDDLNKRLELAQNEAQERFSSEIEQYKSKNEELQAALDKESTNSTLMAELRQQVQQIETQNRLLEETAVQAQANLVSEKQVEFDKLIAGHKRAESKNQEAVAELEKTVAQLTADIAEKDTKLVSSARQIIDIESLKAKNSELEAKLMASAEGDLKDLTKMSVFEEKITALEVENRTLKAEVDAAVKTASTSEISKSGEIVSLKGENQRLKDDLKAERSKAVEMAEAKIDTVVKIASLEAENDKLKQKLEDGLKASEMADANTADMVLSGEVIALKNENERLKQELAEKSLQTAGTSDGSAEELQQLKEDNRTLLTRLENAQEPNLVRVLPEDTKKLEALQAANDELRTQLAAIERQDVIASASLKSLEEENEELRKRAQTVANGSSAVEGELRNQVASLKANNETLQAAFDIKIAESQEAGGVALAKLEADNKALQEQLKTARIEASDIDVEALKSENESITAALEKTLTQLIEHEDALMKKEEELLAARAEKTEVMDTLEDEGGALEDIANLQTKLDAATKENGSLRLRITELEEAPTKLAEMKAQIEALTVENKNLVSEKAVLLSDLRKAHTELELAAASVAEKEAAPEVVTPVSDERSSRILELEQTLRQVDIERQKSIEALAKENLRLRRVLDEERRNPVQQVSIEEEAFVQIVELDEQGSGVEEELKNFESAEPIDMLTEKLQEPEPLQTPLESAEKAEEPMQNRDMDAMVFAESKQVEEFLEPAYVPTPPVMPDRSLNEAQRYEQELAREIERTDIVVPEPTPPVEAVVLPEPEILREEPVVARRSEDPYEAFEGAQEVAKAAPSVVEVNEDTGVVVQRLQVKDKIELSSGRESEMAAVVVPQQDFEKMPAPDAAPPPGTYIPAFEIDKLLSAADIVSNQNVEFVPDASGAQRAVYQWRTNDVYGSAEQKPLLDEKQFEEHVQEYLERTQERCEGDFAIVPDATEQFGDIRVDSYEIACVGGSTSSTASLLFFNHAETFTVLAHEAPTDAMETAMDMRDRLLRTVIGS